MRKILLAAMIATLASLTIAPAHAALKVENTFLRLTIAGGPIGNERVSWDANLSVAGADPASVDPTAVNVEVRLSISMGTVYRKVLPPGSFSRDTDRYVLTDAAKQQSGLDTFNLLRNPTGFAIDLIDKQASLPDAGYEAITMEIAIGEHAGAGGATMVHNGNVWQLNG